MTKNLLVYDLEICHAIPPKNDANRLPDISYCSGWADYQNMGISCISWCILDAETLHPMESHVAIWDKRTQQEIQRLVRNGDVACGGFNSKKFDDKLIQAYGVSLESEFDILELVLEAAGRYGSSYWHDGLSYNLESIAKANDLKKLGSGDMAPILYQKDKIAELLMYCLNDSIIESEILRKLLKGTLTDPNTGLRLFSPGVETVLYLDRNS